MQPRHVYVRAARLEQSTVPLRAHAGHHLLELRPLDDARFDAFGKAGKIAATDVKVAAGPEKTMLREIGRGGIEEGSRCGAELGNDWPAVTFQPEGRRPPC